VLITDSFLPLTATATGCRASPSGLRRGWRFSNAFSVQYVYSTSYTADSGGNTLMLRYTFHLQR